MDQGQQPMEVDHPNVTDIIGASKGHLLELDQEINYCGISVDIYQFPYHPTNHWNEGHIFNANMIEDLSFDGMVESSDVSNKREAGFLVHEIDKQVAVENMMVRGLSLKHVGILKPFVAGYNSQISKVISAFKAADLTLDVWLKAEKEKLPSNSIPSSVQNLIRTAYQAIVEIWLQKYTSDSLADVSSYHMIENKIKIDPLCIHDRNAGEDVQMLLRKDFGTMILENIYPLWQDRELVDFVHLLNNPRAWVVDVLGAPLLLSPAERELMYHHYGKAELEDWQLDWLQENASPEAGWKDNARNEDEALKAIIDSQPQRDKRRGLGFSTDINGAFHFAKVVTAHYLQYFRKTAEGQSGASMKGRVDSLLKHLLPCLLTRRYNSEYEYDAGH